jgi:hypothetical protein
MNALYHMQVSQIVSVDECDLLLHVLICSWHNSVMTPKQLSKYNIIFVTNKYISVLTVMSNDKILILIIVEIYVVILRVFNMVR